MPPRTILALLVLAGCCTFVGCGGAGKPQPTGPAGGTTPGWTATSTELAHYGTDLGVAPGNDGPVLGWNRGRRGQLLLPGRSEPGALPAMIVAGPVSRGADGFALVLKRTLRGAPGRGVPPVRLDLLTGAADGTSMREVTLAAGALETQSLSVGRTGEVAVSWLRCRRPDGDCHPHDSGPPDAALRLATVSPDGRPQPPVTLTERPGDADDVLAFGPGGELLAAYTSGDRVVTRVRPAGGALSRPAVAGPYAGRATLAAGIDARGAVLTAWSEQVCGTQCARLHVRSASRASGATRFSAMQTLDDGRTDSDGDDETTGRYLETGVSGDGRAVVTWTSPTGLHLATGRAGARLGASALLDEDPYAQASLAVDAGGRAVVVWGPERADTLRARVRPRAGTRFGRTELLPRVSEIALPVAGFDPVSGRPTLIAIAHRTLITITRNR